jgi:hypothetical protein
MIFSGKGDKLSVYPPFLHLENPHEKGKSGGFPLFLKKSGFFSKKVLTKQFGHDIIYELSARQRHTRA